MLSQIPIVLERMAKRDLDMEILRAAIIAELDAVSLYLQMAGMTKNEHIRSVGSMRGHLYLIGVDLHLS